LLGWQGRRSRADGLKKCEDVDARKPDPASIRRLPWYRAPFARLRRQWCALTGPVPLRWLPEGVRRRALVLRVVQAAGRDLIHGYLSMQAMSLVYTTLLSLVPLLAVSFSVLKGFGVHNQVEPLLREVLEPLGIDTARELTALIIAFVDNVKVGLLGGVGLMLLIYTVLMLMQKVESALNYTWHIERGRSLGKTFAIYLSVLLIGPLLVFGSLSLTSALATDSFVYWLTHTGGVEAVVRWAGRLVPYALLVVAFTFLYMTVPNTPVRFRPALIGASISALLWELWGWLFALFLANSSGYAIYAAFASLFIFMFWLYGSWLILLIGSSIAFYVQNPQYATVDPDALKLNARARETIAFALLREIAARFHAGKPPWNAEDLARHLDAPDPAVEWTIRALVHGGVLTEAGGSPARLLPARDPASVRLSEVVDILRQADSTGHLSRLPQPQDPQALALVEVAEAARQAALGDRTVASLVERAEEARPPPV
jgi:membrane protein